MVKFVIVNGRKPMRAPFSCACCSEKLEGGYIRETSTDLKYCDLVCFGFFEKKAMGAIDQRARLNFVRTDRHAPASARRQGSRRPS